MHTKRCNSNTSFLDIGGIPCGCNSTSTKKITTPLYNILVIFEVIHIPFLKITSSSYKNTFLILIRLNSKQKSIETVLSRNLVH